MTEIPGGFPKKVFQETFVSNHTGPIRIAEDQMQRLLRCIVMGRIVRDIEEEEPKPEPAPGQIKVSGEGWINPSDIVKSVITKENHCEDCCCARAWAALGITEYTGKDIPTHIRELKTQIECLQSNLDAANDRAHKAARDVERLKQCVEDSDNNATYWRGLVELCTVEKIQKLKKELADQVDSGSRLWLDNKDLLKENEDLKKRLTKLTVLNDTLQAQVLEERACVVLRPYGKYYEIAMPPIIFRDRESAIKWAGERFLEVLE